MAIAFVFPGQGSQIVGMGKDLAEQFLCASEVFQEVDEALGKKLSNIIFEGPQEELTSTINAQPALMAVSMAILAVLKKEGICIANETDYLAGHSLGEYSALCAGEALSLQDTAKLLAIRARSMQEAVPIGKGAMAAIIGLDENLVQEICSQAMKDGAQDAICEIANDNGGGQLVISGDVSAVKLAVEYAKDKGAKRAILLTVSAPFHCSLMKNAAIVMDEALKEVKFSKPLCPILSNVSVMPEEDPDRLKKLLVDQITGRVRWRETIEWFAANNVTKIYEIGPGKVLTGLVKRIDKTIETYNIFDKNSMLDVLKTFDKSGIA